MQNNDIMMMMEQRDNCPPSSSSSPQDDQDDQDDDIPEGSMRMPSVYDGLSSDEECAYDKHNDTIDDTIKDMQNVITNNDRNEDIWVKRNSVEVLSTQYKDLKVAVTSNHDARPEQEQQTSEQATPPTPTPPIIGGARSSSERSSYPGRINVERVLSTSSVEAEAPAPPPPQSNPNIAQSTSTSSTSTTTAAPVSTSERLPVATATTATTMTTPSAANEVVVEDNHSYFKVDDCTSIPNYNKKQYSRGKVYSSTIDHCAGADTCSDTDSDTGDEKPVTRHHGNTYNAVNATDDDEDDLDPAQSARAAPPTPAPTSASTPAQAPPVDYAYFKSVSDQFHGRNSPVIASRLADHVAADTYIQNCEEETTKETQDLLENKKKDALNASSTAAVACATTAAADEDDEEEDEEDDKELTKGGVSKSERRKHKSREESVLIEGVLFRADYLGSTQLISDGRPSKAMRMMQAQEAVGRIKATDNEHQPSTEVDLFISIEKIMILNTDLQEVMMDHALRTISYIADIGETLVIMARRGPVVSTDSDGKIHSKRQSKICCHVFQSDEAQLIAQSIGEAFQVAYSEFLRANGIDDTSLQGKHVDYQEVLNQQEIFGDELNLFAGKQKEVVIAKPKGDTLGVVVVESGWGSMVPTIVLANMSPGGVAAKCGDLNIGDQIMSINGVSLVGLPLSSCENYIKASKNKTVVRLSTISCPPVVEVIIKRPDIKYQLGFSVQNGVICSLLRGGIAERGGVRVGHRIIDINNHSVVAVAHEKIVTLLATSIGEIHMKTMPTSIFRLLTGQDIPHYI